MTTIQCDVRPELRRGEEPFTKIMAAIGTLGPMDRLELWAIFEPVPLYSVLGKQGFDHHAEQVEGGDWRVIFFRPASGM